MEPPQVVDLSSVAYAALGGAISLVWLFLVASYETTFAILSKSVLEKMAESSVSHARAMLRIYEPRLRLRLMTRLGEAIGVICPRPLPILLSWRPSYYRTPFPSYISCSSSLIRVR